MKHILLYHTGDKPCDKHGLTDIGEGDYQAKVMFLGNHSVRHILLGISVISVKSFTINQETECAYLNTQR